MGASSCSYSDLDSAVPILHGMYMYNMQVCCIYNLCMYVIHVIITLDLVLVFMLHIYGKGSGRRGRGRASSRRGKGSSTDEQEATNLPATSGPSLKDQAAELLTNQFLTKQCPVLEVDHPQVDRCRHSL